MIACMSRRTSLGRARRLEIPLGGFGGRLGFAVLVGSRRHHELGMHLTTAFHGHGFGPGPSAPACDAPGRVLQDVPRARLMLTGARGYAYRF